MQIFADVLELPIEVTECEELGALGAAMCAGVAAGQFESLPQAVEAMVRVRQTVQPEMDRRSIYQYKYETYQQVASILAGAWSRFAGKRDSE